MKKDEESSNEKSAKNSEAMRGKFEKDREFLKKKERSNLSQSDVNSRANRDIPSTTSTEELTPRTSEGLAMAMENNEYRKNNADMDTRRRNPSANEFKDNRNRNDYGNFRQENDYRTEDDLGRRNDNNRNRKNWRTKREPPYRDTYNLRSSTFLNSL